jgi:hypothetical protein
VLFEVQAFNGGQGFGIAAHLDEAEAFAAARVAIHDDFRALHAAELGEELLQIRTRSVVAQIPAIQFLSHRNISCGWEGQPAVSLSGLMRKGPNLVAHQAGRAKEHWVGRVGKTRRRIHFVEPTGLDYGKWRG